MIKSAADAVYVFRFIRTLVQRWESTGAYKLGLIDAKGKRLKSPETREEKNAYTFFHRVVFNVKRLFELLPGRYATRLTSYASALYLLREHTELNDDQLINAIKKVYKLTEELDENTILELQENRVYQLKNDMILSNGEIADAGTSITVKREYDTFANISIFEAIHNLTQKQLYVSTSDIEKDLFLEEFSVTTSDVVMPPKPLKTDQGNKYQRFKVPTEVFTRFDRGRKKHQRWKTFLDLTDEKQCAICQFAKKYRDALIVIEDESSGAMRAIRPTSSDGR